MSKNSASKMNEFDKLNNMKDKLKNSKTLNLSLINKNIIRSNNNSEKNMITISPRNEKILAYNESKNKVNLKNNNNSLNNNIILIDSKENDTETKELKYSDTIKYMEQNILKDSEIGINEKNKNVFDKNSNLATSTERCFETDPHRSRAQRHWSIVLNVIRALKNLRNINVHNVHSITEVDNAIDKWQNDLTCTKKENKKTSYDDSFNILGDQILLFDYIANGHEENNENILKIIKKERRIKINKDLEHEEKLDEKEKINDDKNYIVVNLVNHMNIDGFTPLYFACLNGHVKMVDLLIKNGADHLLKCGDKEKGEDDSVLNLAVRWNHIGVVEYLLNLEWPQSYLKEAYSCAKGIKNKVLIKMLDSALKKSSKKKQKKGCFVCF